MKELRPPKDKDQKNIETAFLLIKELMARHNDIEPTLWAGAVWSILVDGYKSSGISYEEFCKEVHGISQHYKPWWDE
jgi:hypothetical protein